MRSSIAAARRSIINGVLAGAGVSVLGLVSCPDARAGGTPVFNAGEAGTFTHLSGDPPVGDPYHVALPFTANTPRLFTHTFTFPAGDGNTNASAGIANSQSTTSTKVIIGAGTGVSQTDMNNSESASSLEVFFNAEWTVPAAGFGAPLAGNFSLPIGVKLGTFGSASVSATMDWDYIRGASESPLEHFASSKSFPATDFNQSILTSITAPTVLFSPSQLVSGDTLVMTGDIIFTADADDPVLIEVPTAADFSDLGVTTDQDATFSTDVIIPVPEPASLVMLTAGTSMLLRRRRKLSSGAGVDSL